MTKKKEKKREELEKDCAVASCTDSLWFCEGKLFKSKSLHVKTTVLCNWFARDNYRACTLPFTGN